MNRKFMKLFIKFFIPYLLIIVLMIVVSTTAYILAFNNIERKTMTIQEAYLEQSKSVLDRHFTEAIDASSQIQQIPMVSAFKIKTKEDLEENFTAASELRNQIKNIRFVNKVIEEYFICYKNTGIIANAYNINYHMRYGEAFFSVEGYSKESYWDGLFEDYYFGTIKPEENFSFFEQNMSGIPMITTIGYDFESPEAVILLILNSEKLKEVMIGNNHQIDGDFFIVDENDTTVLQMNELAALDENGKFDASLLKDDYVVFNSASDVVDFSYYMAVPKGIIYAEIDASRQTASIFILLVLIVGLITSLISARLNAVPVHKMVTNNEDLNERVKNQLPYIRRDFLERWLKGDYTNIEEITSMTKYLKFNYLGDFYCVAVIDYDEQIDLMGDELNEDKINELEIKRLVVKDILTKDALKPEYVHDLKHDKLAVIFIANDLEKSAFEVSINRSIRQCNDLLQARGLTEIRCAIGNICDDMTEVATSLYNALDALSTITGTEKEIIWYVELPENLDSYYYPSEIESRLYNATRSGDLEQVKHVLGDVLKKNILKKTLPSHMMKIFIYEIWGTLAKLLDKVGSQNPEVHAIITDAFMKVGDMSDLENIQYCKGVFMEVARILQLDKEGRQEHIMESINAYVDENYNNPEFGLPMIADEFKLSYTYISHIFKDFNDVSFTNYLLNLRMDEAGRLLVETNMPVKDIVTATGYNSSNTFGKAFKRKFGVTASVYRRRQKSLS